MPFLYKTALMAKEDSEVGRDSPGLQEADLEPCTCRLCWGEEESAPEGRLVSPCSCSGSLEWIHVRCLRDWMSTQRAQGLGRRAHICELW